MKRHLLFIILYSILFAYVVNRFSSLFTRIDPPMIIPISSTIPSIRSVDPNDTVSTARTLIVYVYGKTHASAWENLKFFIQTAVRSSYNADYYFILQQIHQQAFDEKSLPELPSNAHYIQHENKCFDLGTVGWFLSSGRIDKTKYKYFIFLNSSVRGPFIVAYYDNPIWYTVFTRRLTDQIKLMGSTISCESAPHVQSYLWTMDIHTLNFFLKNTTIFTCHKTKTDTINKGEVLASQILLNSGFQIASLMRKYQGLDFRQNVTEKCPKNQNPSCDKRGNSGVTHDPYEVVFVKAKDGRAPFHDNFERIRAYEKWMD